MGQEIKLTWWQRLKSATPTFFKKVQIFALGIAALGGTLATIHGIPEKITTIMISVGTAVAAVSQFAVKQINPDEPGTGS